MFKYISFWLLFLICGFHASSRAATYPQFPIIGAPAGGWVSQFSHAQAHTAQYIEQTLNNISYPGSTVLKGALLGTGPLTVLDLPGFTDTMGSQPDFDNNGNWLAPNPHRSGVGFIPDCPNDCWDPSIQSWVIPLNDSGIVGIEVLYKPYVNNSPLSVRPIPGQPLPGLILTPVGDPDYGGAAISSLRVEMQFRTTSRFGQDLNTVGVDGLPAPYPLQGDLGASIQGSRANIGLWADFFETTPGGGQWTTGNTYRPYISGRGTAVTLGLNACALTGQSRMNSDPSGYSRGSNMILTLPTVANSNFSTNPGAIVEGPNSLGGAFVLQCYKYNYQNVTLTMSANSTDGEFHRGVVLTDPSVAGRSTNVGAQILIGFSKGNELTASTPFREFSVGFNQLGSNPDNLLESRGAATLRFPGTGAIVTTTSQISGLGIHIKPRYYKIGNGPAAPGLVQAIYTLNMDYQ